MNAAQRNPARTDAANYDAVIVGAGLAGAGMAAALAGRGWRVLLLERDRFPRHKVCGEFLSPEAQQSMRTLGVHAAVAGLSPVPLSGAAITTTRGSTVALELPAPAWGLSRYALDGGLAAAVCAAGGEVWEGATVTGARRAGDTTTVEVRRGAGPQARTLTVAGRALIMACGRHSLGGLPPHNNAAGDARRGWRHCAGLKIHYEGVEMPPRTELYLFPGGYVGINPVEGGRANVCLLITYAALQELGKDLRCILAAAAARHPLFAQRLANAHPRAESECAVAPVDTQRPPAPWDAALDAPCLGDTAAMIPPLAGDGMAMALRSAELCLAGADAYLRGEIRRTDWARSYVGAWQAEFGGRLKLGQALQSALTTPALGDVLGSLGGRLPFAARWLLEATRGRMA
jgi:flavin-dependent dehydrogenase